VTVTVPGPPIEELGSDLTGIFFDTIKYFVRSTEKQATSWDDLPEETTRHLMQVSQRIAKALKEVYPCRRVALMIKKDFTSERIAGLLNMSPHTIKTHRRSIRKKLALHNSKVNLSSYLKLKFSKDSPFFIKDGMTSPQDQEI